MVRGGRVGQALAAVVVRRGIPELQVRGGGYWIPRGGKGIPELQVRPLLDGGPPQGTPARDPLETGPQAAMPRAQIAAP